jgi:hypothetical protein
LELPLTEAVYCQFAPAPIGHGGVAEDAQGEFEMLTVACCCGWVVLDEEPPHPARVRRMDTTIVAK